MSFENNNERKIDQFPRSQEAQMSIAQQAWSPQAGKEQHKPSGERSDAHAQEQLNAGLSDASIRHAYQPHSHQMQEIERIVKSSHRSYEKTSTEDLIDGFKNHDWAKQMIQDINRYHQSQPHHA